MIAFLIMKPYEFNIIQGGIQRAEFLPFIGAAIGGLASGAAGLVSGAASVVAPAVSAIGSGIGATAGWLGETAIGAGGAVLGGIGELAGGIFETGAGMVKGAGTALFGGQALEPVISGGEIGSLSETSAGGGLFGSISGDTLANVAKLGYGIYMTQEQMKLAEKAIEAQAGAGYYVVAPGAPTPATTFAPTTAVTMPGAAVGEPPTLFQTEQGANLIKYGAIAVIAYLVLKGGK